MNNLNKIASNYLKVISSFKNRYDVQNGFALGYRDNQDPNGNLRFENKPHTIGEGLTTTGYCVSVSQSLLYDKVFQTYISQQNANAKLISIDIKEQFYGECYNGVKNTWHTAILVEEQGVCFVIDLTCGQFGNRYINKDIWDFYTWENTFRSPNCKHRLTDFNGVNMSSFATIKSTNNCKLNKDSIRFDISKYIGVTDEEVNFMIDYFVEKYEIMNNKLVLGMLNKFDIKYIKTLNGILENFDFSEEIEKPLYSVLMFSNKKDALSWMKGFTGNNYSINNYMYMFDSISKACEYFDIKEDDINKDTLEDENNKYPFYIIIESVKTKGIDAKFLQNGIEILLPYGYAFNILNKETDIFNGYMLKNQKQDLQPIKTNTIYIKSK